MDDEGDKQWAKLFEVLKEKLRSHKCPNRRPDYVQAVEITAEEEVISTSLWLSEDGSFEPSDFEPEKRVIKVNFIKVECLACHAKLV